MKKLLAAALPAAFFSTFAMAGDHGLYGGISTLGLGAGYKYSINESLGLRVGYNAFQLTDDTTDKGVTYDGKLKFNTLEMLGDYHPWKNGFTLTAGVMYNRSKLTADSNTAATSITINGITYTGSNVSAHYENDLDSDKWSPYVGVGWTSKPAGKPGFGFNVRLGALFQDPKGTLTTSGINDPSGTLETNRAAAERNLNDEADKVKVYPVVGVGISYVF